MAGIWQTFGKALSPGVLGAIQKRFIREGFGLRSNILPFRLYHFGSGRTRGPGVPGSSPLFLDQTLSLSLDPAPTLVPFSHT